MKLSKYLVVGGIAVSAMLSTSSCVGDLNVEPDDPNTITKISSKADMESLFGALYYDLLTGDGLSVSDGGAGSYMRCHFNLQEITADECFISDKWNDPGYTVLNFNTWGNDNEWIYAAYSRENHLAKLASVFISDLHTYGPQWYTDEEIKQMDAEARTLRGFANYCLIDLFGRGPWVDENSETGAVPETCDRATLFERTVADLKANVPNMIPAAQQSYGRLSREAGYMLLAKLYLNAEVYTGTPMWKECADALKNVVGTGLELAPEYKYLFCASNDKYVGNGEIVWGIPQKIGFTETWGGTTYLTCGAWMEADGDDTPLAEQLKKLNNHGTPWSGLRIRPELSKALNGDPRRLLYEGDYQEAIPDLASYKENSCGYMLIKYTNTTEDDYYNENHTGDTYNNGTQVSDTDYPLFRLADAYLMLAECQLHGIECDGFTYFNKVRERVGLDPIAAPTASEILKERQCELYMEGHRRSDLIRFKLYTGTAYLWSWKGGEYTGAGIADTRALYPIPYQYIATIGQNPGY
ncbi:MAG: RagB/SusD family nutrient uptake outer membrane protein [Muribaculaceae bacterium]|nr:RagB/SusD family nutrient uptake outer membrane protein [Muribaculaceae bacterium]